MHWYLLYFIYPKITIGESIAVENENISSSWNHTKWYTNINNNPTEKRYGAQKILTKDYTSYNKDAIYAAVFELGGSENVKVFLRTASDTMLWAAISSWSEQMQET